VQQPVMPVIGFLNSLSAERWPYLAAFHQGLREGGVAVHIHRGPALTAVIKDRKTSELWTVDPLSTRAPKFPIFSRSRSGRRATESKKGQQA
jgi:hypothetical protein